MCGLKTVPKGSCEFGDRTFQFLRASDVTRDSMGFEAWEGDKHVAEVFLWDSDSKATLSTYEDDLPVELIEYLLTEVLRQITPVTGRTIP